MGIVLFFEVTPVENNVSIIQRPYHFDHEFKGASNKTWKSSWLLSVRCRLNFSSRSRFPLQHADVIVTLTFGENCKIWAFVFQVIYSTCFSYCLYWGFKNILYERFGEILWYGY